MPADHLPLLARLQRWTARRLANRLMLWAGTLTLGVLALGLLAGLALTRWMAGNYAASLLELRATHVSQGVARQLTEFEAGVLALTRNTFVINALSDSAGRDVYLGPFLRQHPLRSMGASLKVCDSANTLLGSDDAPSPRPPVGCATRATADAVLAAGQSRADVVVGPGGPVLHLLIPVRYPVTGTHEGLVSASLPLTTLGAGDATVQPAGTLRRPTGADRVLDRALTLPAVSLLAPLNLVVHVSLPATEGQLPFAPVVGAYALLGLLLAGVAVAVTARLAGRVVAPVNDLAALSRRAARGDQVELTPGLDSPDEVGELAHAFKHMADSMGQANRQLAQQIDALVEARNQAQAANVAKSEFLAVMSHEIRTPMNAVLGLLYVTLRSPLEPRQRDHVAKAHRAAKGLLSVINDILDFSKIEAGKLVLDLHPFRLDELLTAVTDAVEVAAQEKSLTLHVQVAPALPAVCVGDALRLRQVLINLVGNAVKFTDTGRVTLRLEPGTDHGTHQDILFTVEDTGIGMSAAQQAALFQPFTQVDSSPSRRYQGTGLGLAISQSLVVLMGGRLRVQSEPGVGSRFGSALPLGRPAEAGTAAPLPGPGEPVDGPAVAALRGRRVLVVDDNDVNRLVASELLTLLGLQPVQAGDGSQALALLAQDPQIQFVLMDSHMPVMDGCEATRQIRLQPQWQRLPVIAMTADALEEDRAHCIAAGMNDFVVKPLTIEALQAALLRWTPPGR